MIAIVNIEIFWLFRQFIKMFQHNQQYDTLHPITPCMHKLKAGIYLFINTIDLDYGTVWTHVVYIASELCKYVVDVYVQCIKYRVDFFKIGFYPNIFIKTPGEWRLEW